MKFNNDKSRDYTNPNLPTGEGSMDQGMNMSGMGLGQMSQQGEYWYTNSNQDI